jgi:hypothetical protein
MTPGPLVQSGSRNVGGAYAAPGNSVATYVHMSPGIGIPFRFPGVFGQMVLTVSYVPLIGVLRHDDGQIGSMSFTVPNDNSLRGLQVAIQGVAYEQARNYLTITNNAILRILP